MTQDTRLRPETKIYYSKNKAILRFALLIAVISVGIYMFLLEKPEYMGLIIIAIGVAGTMINLRIFLNNDPQIIISNTGLQTNKAPLYAWSQIANIEVQRRFTGKTIIYFLRYDCPLGQVKVRLSSLDISPSRLIEIINAYSI